MERLGKVSILAGYIRFGILAAPRDEGVKDGGV
jgi:hypothetical protein